MSREIQVTNFTKAMGQPVGLTLRDADKQHLVRVLDLRASLLSEEVSEVFEECENIIEKLEEDFDVTTEDIAKLLSELADLQYVLSGFAITFGLPLREAFNRIHDANMSKLDDNGNPIYRADGKIMKGPNYKKAVLDDLVALRH